MDHLQPLIPCFQFYMVPLVMPMDRLDVWPLMQLSTERILNFVVLNEQASTIPSPTPTAISIGLGCGSVGITVASQTRGTWFESNHQPNFVYYM